ncbi:MAG TPA: RsmB/NOP family class I SAM-dependent RNA methyltransferase [Saprospiraceae bacterium]|nr:RsmB/NOP family class I SAM-dependent RNA methyltransferase [Saprospiraceae bacterium]HMP24145.1 RsmB/NOP family class I SAM-dependent RNA methyltransferase [Saprospiraceae bacterium]
MSKLHPNLVQAVVEALQQIFQEGYYADKVIERLLRSNPKWGARDRAFIAESVYDMVRWYRLLYEVQGREPANSADWLRLFGIWQVVRGETPPDWPEFKSIDVRSVLKKVHALQGEARIRESVPDWLYELIENQLGGSQDAILQALNEPAQVVLRANTLQISPARLQKQLQQEGVETSLLDGAALLVSVRKNLFTTKAFQEGLFEVQDYSSQQVAPFLQVAPGMRVVDACAGGGGKSLHIAALMEDKGHVIAMDTEGRKLEELRKRARRAGTSIIETRTIDNNKAIKRLENTADRVLLDVPCSGLGVLRRNPDAKWKLSPEFVEKVQVTQYSILTSYSRMCKPGGRIVYATCSILPIENQQQVQRFLAAQDGKFVLLEDQTISPIEGFDGFYMALMERKV